MTVGLTGVVCLFAALWFWLRVPVLRQAAATEAETGHEMATAKPAESGS
jgi:hypothetical protein